MGKNQCICNFSAINCKVVLVSILLSSSSEKLDLHSSLFNLNAIKLWKKSIAILYENNHYITRCKKNCFFLEIYFSFYHNISIFFHFRGQRCLVIFNSVLFTQEITKESILLYMDYEVALRLKNVETQK